MCCLSRSDRRSAWRALSILPPITAKEEWVTDYSNSTDDAVSEAHDIPHRSVQAASEEVQRVGGSVLDRVRAEIDVRSATTGERVGAVSQAMRDMSGQLRSQGNDLPARLTGEVADRAERLGGYLRESDTERMLGDVEDFGRRQPWVMAAAGLAIGVVAARFLRSSSRHRLERRRGGTVGATTATAAPAEAGSLAAAGRTEA
jgi:hypothetical protein